MARLSSPQAKRKAPPNANFASLSHDAINTPPRDDNFKFRNYRSPGCVSDDSDTEKSIRKPSRAPPEVQINTQPVGPRKDRKARFSFVAARHELSSAATGRTSAGRPSILTINEEPSESMVPAARAPVAADKAPSKGSKGVRFSSEAAPSKSRESSRLSVSEYYDAAEEQSIVNHMDSIQENEDEMVQSHIKRQQEDTEDEDDDTTIDYISPTEANKSVRSRVEQDRIDEEEEYEEGDSTNTILPETYDSQDNQSSGDEDESSSDSDSAQEGDLVLRDDTLPASKPRSMYAGRTPDSQQLPCTRATPSDTRRLKATAIALVRYEESEGMYAALMDRLQRMTDREEEVAGREGRDEVSLSRLAKRLHSWLDETKEGRIVTGEKITFVKHELEWANWIWEAARTGVLHVKGRRCRCRPEWRRVR